MSELVYPIYIDRDMIVAFLASLEGGILDRIHISQSGSQSKDASKPSKGSITESSIPYGLDSSRLNEIDLSQTGTITFPEASLFIRLRNLLLASKGVITVSNDTNLDDIAVGNLVEFTAKFSPTPLQKLRKIMDIMPILFESDREGKMVDINTQIALLDKAKPNEAIKLGDTIQKFDALTLSYLRARLKAQKESLASGFGEESITVNLLSRTLVSGASEILLGEGSNIRFLCRAYQKFAREGVFDDIYNCEWRVLGKVIGKIDRNDDYDTLAGSALHILPIEAVEGVFGGLSSTKMNIDFSNTRLKGPLINIATLGIFS